MMAHDQQRNSTLEKLQEEVMVIEDQRDRSSVAANSAVATLFVAASALTHPAETYKVMAWVSNAVGDSVRTVARFAFDVFDAFTP